MVEPTQNDPPNHERDSAAPKTHTGRETTASYPNSPPTKEETVRLNGIHATFMLRTSDVPEYFQVDISLNDLARSELYSDFKWSEKQLSEIDNQIFARMGESRAVVFSEDDDFLVVEIPRADSRDPVTLVKTALETAIAAPLEDRELEPFKERHWANKEQLREAREAELAKFRTSTSLYRACNKTPSDSPGGHSGYVTLTEADVRRAKGFSYNEEAFLRSADPAESKVLRRTALKPDMVFLELSVQDEPFRGLYPGQDIPYDSRQYATDYSSVIPERLRGMVDSPTDIQKIEVKPLTVRVDNTPEGGTETFLNGESAMVLCTRDAAEKIHQSIRSLYSYLEEA